MNIRKMNIRKKKLFIRFNIIIHTKEEYFFNVITLKTEILKSTIYLSQKYLINK